MVGVTRPNRFRRRFESQTLALATLVVAGACASTSTPPQAPASSSAAATGEVPGSHWAPPDLSWLLTADPSTVGDEQLLEHARHIQRQLRRDHLSWGIVYTAEFLQPEDPRPRGLGNGGDAALFTGFSLAAAVYRFRVEPTREHLDAVLRALQGLHILTHISGTPGVLARAAFPATEKARFGFPAKWGGRLYAFDDDERRERYGRPGPYVYPSGDDVDNVLHEYGCLDPQPPTYPPMIFYTRTSRDQLTGVMFGLVAVLTEFASLVLDDAELDADRRKAREIAGGIFDDVFGLLEERARERETRTRVGTAPRTSMRVSLSGLDLVLRDHLDQGGSAGRVRDLLRTVLLTTARVRLLERVRIGELDADAPRVREVEHAYEEAWKYFGPLNVDWLVNPLARNYFPWNLRFASVHMLAMLENASDKRARLAEYVKSSLWRHVRNDGNAFFILLYNDLRGERSNRIDDAIRGLRELYLRQNTETGSMRSFSSPLFGHDSDGAALPVHLREPTGYFLWQKNPFDAGGLHPDEPRDVTGRHQSTGLDFLLPYWLARVRGFLPEPEAR